MRHFKTKKGAFKQQLKKWGGLVTFDFLTPERVGQLGIETDTNVFVVRDVYSGVRMNIFDQGDLDDPVRSADTVP